MVVISENISWECRWWKKDKAFLCMPLRTWVEKSRRQKERSLGERCLCRTEGRFARLIIRKERKQTMREGGVPKHENTCNGLTARSVCTCEQKGPTTILMEAEAGLQDILL